VYYQEVSELGKQDSFGEYTVSVTEINTLHGLLDKAHQYTPSLLALSDNVTSRSRRSSDISSLFSCYKISKRRSDFFTLEELILHSFQARIIAIYWSIYRTQV
jgi:hypothetical protein